jgi:hypothetical protein
VISPDIHPSTHPNWHPHLSTNIYGYLHISWFLFTYPPNFSRLFSLLSPHPIPHPLPLASSSTIQLHYLISTFFPLKRAHNITTEGARNHVMALLASLTTLLNNPLLVTPALSTTILAVSFFLALPVLPARNPTRTRPLPPLLRLISRTSPHADWADLPRYSPSRSYDDQDTGREGPVRMRTLVH